jgi:hypothetical protein
VPPRTSITFGVLFSDQYDLSVLKGPENGTKEVRLLNNIYSDWNFQHEEVKIHC